MPDCSARSFILWNCSRRSRKIYERTQRNKENNGGDFQFGLEFVEFCPKSANFRSRQGINRELCKVSPKLPAVKRLAPFFAGFKKLTGKEQEFIIPFREKHSARLDQNSD